jgi:hypothetical protein
MKTKRILLGLAFVVLTTWASAQNDSTGNAKQNGTCKGSGFVDKNKNGTCDNAEKVKTTGTGNNRNNTGKGKCNGKKNEKCQSFVDANKNGVCDNSEANKKK